jgi:hypothetical protein
MKLVVKNDPIYGKQTRRLWLFGLAGLLAPIAFGLLFTLCNSPVSGRLGTATVGDTRSSILVWILCVLCGVWFGSWNCYWMASEHKYGIREGTNHGLGYVFVSLFLIVVSSIAGSLFWVQS